MIWDVYEDEMFEQELFKLTQHLARQPTSSMHLIKKAMNLSWQNPLDEQLKIERHFQYLTGQSPNYKEGVRAFMEKRNPEFD